MAQKVVFPTEKQNVDPCGHDLRKIFNGINHLKTRKIFVSIEKLHVKNWSWEYVLS